MPANFQETVVAGTEWTRTRSLLISNHYGEQPVMHVEMERVLLVEGMEKPIVKDTQRLQVPFVPNTHVQLRDPETGELTGQSVSHEYVYQILYSVAMQAAMAP